MSVPDARQIARRALEATGHRAISPRWEDWLVELIELVRRIDGQER